MVGLNDLSDLSNLNDLMIPGDRIPSQWDAPTPQATGAGECGQKALKRCWARYELPSQALW